MVSAKLVLLLLVSFTALSGVQGRFRKFKPKPKPQPKPCYTGLGCFYNSRWFWGAPKPYSPSKINTRFFLKTSKGYIINTAEQNGFVGNKKTVFIVHGWKGNGVTSAWMNDVANTLYKTDTNVIKVDWRDGAAPTNYLQAAANTRVVGAVMANFINNLVKKGFTSADKVHIIGFSLGGQVAGYAGKRVKGLGRITGLDPAGVYFNFRNSQVRLDRRDAKFVDVYHTSKIGMLKPVGDLDVYVNKRGLYQQPGCKYGQVDCNHGFAPKLFISTIKHDVNKCGGIGYHTRSRGRRYFRSYRYPGCK